MRPIQVCTCILTPKRIFIFILTLKTKAICRLACQMLPALYADYTTPRILDRETDTSWWLSTKNEGRGVRRKRPQMGQEWRTNSGASIM
jgi:hypothetical protein